jgi:hypothetical protein
MIRSIYEFAGRLVLTLLIVAICVAIPVFIISAFPLIVAIAAVIAAALIFLMAVHNILWS